MASTEENVLSEPTMRNLTSNFGKPPEKQSELLQTLGTPHLDSFNNFAREGLYAIVKDLVPMNFTLPCGDRVMVWYENPHIDPPALPRSTKGVKDLRLWPSECRQRKITYKGCLSADICCSVNGVRMAAFKRDLGDIPIMIKSDLCHLSKLSPAELVKRGEHEQEWGGYFIVKGLEKLIRLLVMTRRNYPVALKRNGWKQRGDRYSDIGVTMRCVTEDHTATTNVLHFVTDGSAALMFSSNKSMYFSPLALILKALLDVTDEFIYRKLSAGYESDLYYKGCIRNMLRALHEEGIHSHKEAKEFVGKTFRFKFALLADWATDEEVFDFIAQKCIAIHVDKPEDKFNILVLMCQKLFSVVQDNSCIEGADSIMMHENLVGGYVYQQLLKEKLQDSLYFVRNAITKKASTKPPTYTLNYLDLNNLSKSAGQVGVAFELFLATGNIRSRTGLGLMQDSGLVIVAENINRMRYMSHFRAIHRGAFFQTMRTTEARQLLPDAWGFICPVHTPDGAPCGLLNHLTKDCVVTTQPDRELLARLPALLVSLGMAPLGLPPAEPLAECTVVVLDGRVLGYVTLDGVADFAQRLRMLKVDGKELPYTTEIALVPRETNCGQFPGLFLFTSAARMMRPVTNLAAGKTEMVGTFEQVYLDVCITPEEAHEGVTTHMEISKTGFLSNLASLIPMPDCNQSPRNMYQCQMGKQTMGTPCHTWDIQSETKMYRLQTPASPLFRPVHYDNMKLDDFAMGTNAMVAVISYTGYDMEDAMIINKSSYERGFGHGSLYKTSVFEVTANSFFGLDPAHANMSESLDEDGLPRLGSIIKEYDLICCYYDYELGKFKTERSHSSEIMYVDNVKMCGGETKKACITFRITRNASVGDKFASRAGQKGICSHLWPVEDLPFTETGMVPDIVFNPHGFPSRMTIAMMIEIMAGKSAAIHGLVHDATPFKFSEKDTAIDFFGRMLEAGGYNYYGTEKMYSGTDGRQLNVAIFFGVVHYQRLRHMVSDKWQVRSTGPVDIQTNQPVKGRRRGGGIRFGEMERDSLLSHGASFLLQDRLFHCSDKTTALLCRACGNLLSSYVIPMTSTTPPLRWCMLCQEKGDVGEIEIPYIFRYLVNQMAAVNIKIKINIKDQE